MLLDISSVINLEFHEIEVVLTPFWWVIVDERNQMKFSNFSTNILKLNPHAS
jgi:hypothetical protein